VSPRTGSPVLITGITALFVAAFAGFFTIGDLAELANAGTLLAFIAVGACMMILRRTQPDLPRIFRCPAPYVVGTFAVLGCAYLMLSLPAITLQRFVIWNVIGLAVYLLYGRARSILTRDMLAAER
jgi:basic amino acid/polyamine antiporter, APA family